MEKSVQIEMFPDLPTWEERLKARQEALSGKAHEACLLETAPSVWPRSVRQCRIQVAAMCLSVNTNCEACKQLLTNYK